MKKLIFTLVLLIGIASISGCKQFSRNVTMGKIRQPANSEDSRNKGNMSKYGFSPQILFLITDDSGLSPALWWSYPTSGKAGC